MKQISKPRWQAFAAIFWLLSSSALSPMAYAAKDAEVSVPPETNPMSTLRGRSQAAELPALLSDEQRNEHTILAISLRNQRLLEQQAESRAKQLLFQLQAAEAWAAIQRIGGEFSDASASAKDEVSPNIPDAISRYRLHVLIYRDATWLARVSDGERLITLRHGDMVWPGVVAHIQRYGVRFVAAGWQYQLAAE